MKLPDLDGTLAQCYLELRAQLHDPHCRVLRVPENANPEFWRWYAGMLRADCTTEVVPASDRIATFPPANGQVCLWYSGGVESTYTLDRIRDLDPVLLSYEDYSGSVDQFRLGGQVHLILAVLAAHMGFSTTYLGVERNDLFLSVSQKARSMVERVPLFIDRWNDFHADHVLRTACADFHKEELLVKVLDAGHSTFSSCDRIAGGWCTDCFKCYEAYYSAKAMGRDLGFKLSRRVYSEIHDGEYLEYLNSGFRVNRYNAQQYFVRLQILYGLEFDMAADCA